MAGGQDEFPSWATRARFFSQETGASPEGRGTRGAATGAMFRRRWMATATKLERKPHEIVDKFPRFVFSKPCLSVPFPHYQTYTDGLTGISVSLVRSVWRQPDRAGPASERSDQKSETIASAEKSGTKRVHGLMEESVMSSTPSYRLPLGTSSTAADRCGDVTCVCCCRDHLSSRLATVSNLDRLCSVLSCPVVVAHAEVLLPSSLTAGNVGEGQREGMYGIRIRWCVHANANQPPSMPMLRDEAAIPASPIRARLPRSRRESGPCVQCSRGVEPVWIIAGDRIGVEEMNCEVVWSLDIVYRHAVVQ